MKYSLSNSHGNYYVFEPVDKIYEIDILNHWFQLSLGNVLYTVDNKIITIVNLGVKNRNEGPDIKNAILMIDGKISIGDIEFHIKESDWYKHKHDSNNNYDNVILHVVRYADLNVKSLNIPTVELKGSYSPINDCTLTDSNKSRNILDSISHYSFTRWQQKIEIYSGLHKSIHKTKKELVIKAFEIIGAGGNKAQFNNLAKNIDIFTISNFKTIEIENYLIELSKSLNINWNRRGIRPNQQPQNRLRLAAELVYYLLNINFLINNKLRDFKNHFLNSCPSAKGVGIQTELIGNVFLPFFASKALFDNNIIQYSQYFNDWKKLKLPYSYNKYINRFSSILSKSELKYFYILQGLIEIDNKWCKLKNCNICPFKNNYDIS